MNVEAHHTPDELQTLYRTEMNARFARRIQGVVLARGGLTCPQIMKVTGAGRRTVQEWIAKYNRGGIAELLDRPRSGRPGKLSADAEAALARRIEAGPTEDDGVSVFSGPVIAEIIEREFGVLYSLRGVECMLHRLGYSYLCPRPTHEKSDPAAQEAFKKNSRKQWAKLPRSIQTSE